MSRIRTIKPAFWKNESLSALPEATHMLAAAILNYSDDSGYFNANPLLIRAECCPLREPSVSIPESLRSLQVAGYIRMGRGPDGRAYGQVIQFRAHQKISHPTKSEIEGISIDWDNSGKLPEPSMNTPEPLRPEGNKEGKGMEEDAAPSAAAPNSEEVELFRRGKQVLGGSSGGLIKNLIKAKQGSFALARAAIETSSTKENPREYIGAILGGTGPPDDARARGDAW